MCLPHSYTGPGSVLEAIRQRDVDELRVLLKGSKPVRARTRLQIYLREVLAGAYRRARLCGECLSALSAHAHAPSLLTETAISSARGYGVWPRGAHYATGAPAAQLQHCTRVQHTWGGVIRACVFAFGDWPTGRLRAVRRHH